MAKGIINGHVEKNPTSVKLSKNLKAKKGKTPRSSLVAKPKMAKHQIFDGLRSFFNKTKEIAISAWQIVKKLPTTLFPDPNDHTYFKPTAVGQEERFRYCDQNEIPRPKDKTRMGALMYLPRYDECEGLKLVRVGSDDNYSGETALNKMLFGRWALEDVKKQAREISLARMRNY